MERREASASRWTRAAPQSARIVAPDSATTEILRLSALRPPPHGADGKEKSKTRAQKRAAGTKKTALFDIVKRSVAATRSVPAEGAPRRVIGPMEGERGPRGTACRACVDTATNAPNPKFAHTVGQNAIANSGFGPRETRFEDGAGGGSVRLRLKLAESNHCLKSGGVSFPQNAPRGGRGAIASTRT